MKRVAISSVSYLDLYKKWEKGNWSAYDIDFSQDKQDWQNLSSDQKEAMLWILRLFYAGEDEVTDTLAPFAKSLWTEEQRYMLTTQQVDEARHSLFFTRFFSEVIQSEQDKRPVAEFLQPAMEKAFQHDGFGRIFRHLRSATGELDKNPTKWNTVRASANYHLIVEATLAQQGQEFIREYVCKDRFPGLKEGLKRISHDEHRHIAFGMRIIYDCIQYNPRYREALFQTIAVLAPHLVDVFAPPKEEYITMFGASQEEIIQKGFQSLLRKLRSIGINTNSIPRWSLPLDLTVEEDVMARKLVKLNRALRTQQEDIDVLVEAFAWSFSVKKTLTLGVQVDDKRWWVKLTPGTDPEVEKLPAQTRRKTDVVIKARRQALQKAVLEGELWNLRPKGNLMKLKDLAFGSDLPRVYALEKTSALRNKLPSLYYK